MRNWRLSTPMPTWCARWRRAVRDAIVEMLDFFMAFTNEPYRRELEGPSEQDRSWVGTRSACRRATMPCATVLNIAMYKLHSLGLCRCRMAESLRFRYAREDSTSSPISDLTAKRAGLRCEVRPLTDSDLNYTFQFNVILDRTCRSSCRARCLIACCWPWPDSGCGAPLALLLACGAAIRARPGRSGLAGGLCYLPHQHAGSDPYLLPVLWPCRSWASGSTNTHRSIIALIMATSAYGCEIMRGGFLSVRRSEIEAAETLGFSSVPRRSSTWWCRTS